MTELLRARWLLPVTGRPIADGWVAVEDGRVAAVGEGPGPCEPVTGGRLLERDLGRVALLPGLVNAHTHLELSYLAGAVPAAARFTDWIRSVMALRRTQPDPRAPVIVDAAASAIGALRRAGTAVVGDISNTLVTVPLLDASGVAATVFYELLRFTGVEAKSVLEDALTRLRGLEHGSEVRVWLAAHAPYSVSARLLRLIGRALQEDSPAARTSIHLAESVEERQLLEHGTGPWRKLLGELGAWDETWSAPGCGPVEYVDGLGLLGAGTLAVHGVQMDRADLARLARAGATLVTCPRSNRHVGVGDPPIAAFYESGVNVAVGTDSLASAPDLAVWGELAAMRRLAPEVPAARLIESATLVGARALGFGARAGSIEPGKRAVFAAVDVPPGVEDIEEYVVGGIDVSQVHECRFAKAECRMPDTE